ncbi:MAG: helix-turn-helix domain-containing protein [Oscillospiraceae bacterium]|nr:helix-turn-helix domain-containing protein [Oscillospiraceae bacterium]
MTYKVGTTQQIVKQLHQEGYQISEYALRRWIAEGAIPSVSSGKKRLVVYAHVIAFLTTGSVALEPITASV